MDEQIALMIDRLAASTENGRLLAVAGLWTWPGPGGEGMEREQQPGDRAAWESAGMRHVLAVKAVVAMKLSVHQVFSVS